MRWSVWWLKTHFQLIKVINPFYSLTSTSLYLLFLFQCRFVSGRLWSQRSFVKFVFRSWFNGWLFHFKPFKECIGNRATRWSPIRFQFIWKCQPYPWNDLSRCSSVKPFFTTPLSISQWPGFRTSVNPTARDGHPNCSCDRHTSYWLCEETKRVSFENQRRSGILVWSHVSLIFVLCCGVF